MARMVPRCIAVPALACALGVSTACIADEARNWDASVGVGLAQVPDYSGAHSGSARLWIWVDGTYRTESAGSLVLDSGSLTIAPEARWDFVDSKSAGIGLLVGYRPGRTDRDPKTFRGNDGSSDLQGLPPVGSAIDAGFAGHVTVGGLPVFAQVRSALSGAQGTLVNIGAYLPLGSAAEIEWTIVPTVTWANARQMRAFYGVSPESATVSRFPTYQPGGGWENAAIEVGADRRIHGNWHVLASIAYERLLGTAARSPLVQTPTQPKALLGVTLDF